VGVTVGPGRRARRWTTRSLAPVIADAHELRERERAVTRLVAHGLETGTI
jgi:hypothetical protein